jgi:hypothetical protein
MIAWPNLTRRSMCLQAFKEGGCFHSRTAVGMFPELQAAVNRGEVGRCRCCFEHRSPYFSLIKVLSTTCADPAGVGLL